MGDDLLLHQIALNLLRTNLKLSIGQLEFLWLLYPTPPTDNSLYNLTPKSKFPEKHRLARYKASSAQKNTILLTIIDYTLLKQIKYVILLIYELPHFYEHLESALWKLQIFRSHNWGRIKSYFEQFRKLAHFFKTMKRVIR